MVGLTLIRAPEHHAPVLGPTLGAGVVCNRLGFTQAFGRKAR